MINLLRFETEKKKKISLFVAFILRFFIELVPGISYLFPIGQSVNKK